MNQAHKLGKLKNRLNRCKKRLENKEHPVVEVERRDAISKRITELEAQLK